MEICNFFDAWHQNLSLEVSKDRWRQNSLPTTKAKEGRYSLFSHPGRQDTQRGSAIGNLLLPGMLSHERVMQHAETEVNGMVESVQHSHH